MSNVLHLKIVEAKDIPKMDTVGLTDPYIVLHLGTGPEMKTSVKKNTLTPVWNETFSIPVTDVNAKLSLLMEDKDVAADDKISTLDIEIKSLPYGQVVDQWFQLNPVKGVKNGGSIHLVLHFCDAQDKAFVASRPPPPPPHQEPEHQEPPKK